MAAAVLFPGICGLLFVSRNLYSLTSVFSFSLKRPIIFIERCEALRVLHDHVQHKDRIHAHTAVVSYAQTETGVEVTVSDGSVHHGDILIGADGIHSRVRGLMAKEIGKDDPDLSQEIEGGQSSNTRFTGSEAPSPAFTDISSSAQALPASTIRCSRCPRTIRQTLSCQTPTLRMSITTAIQAWPRPEYRDWSFGSCS